MHTQTVQSSTGYLYGINNTYSFTSQRSIDIYYYQLNAMSLSRVISNLQRALIS